MAERVVNERVPSCSTLRTVAATASARELDPQDRLLISSHMVHSEQVHKKYYERLQTSHQDTVAFKIRERMIEGTETDSDESEPMPNKARQKGTTKKQDKKAPHRKVFYTDKELWVIKKWASTDLFGR